MRHGVDPPQAPSRAIANLRHWELNEVDVVLSKLQRPAPDYCLFRSAEVAPSALPADPAEHNALQRWWPSLWARRPHWVAPPRHMVERSAKEGRALCVNAAGCWELRADGYVALSHVWAEGLQRVEAHGGVEATKIAKVFELLRRAGLRSEWIWTDVLVIPGGGGREDEVLTAKLINSMPTVYGNAEAVLVIDAVVVQLHSTEPVDVAVGLCLGKWSTRVWTYQEIKLAKRAVVVTGSGGVEFADIAARLEELQKADRPKYRDMYLWMAIMGRSDKHRLTIRDLATACVDRSSGVDIDYARAFFPVLGLEWEPGMTREDGMEMIYRAYLRDALVISPFAGSPRMKQFPGWAPSYLQGLEGSGHGGLASEERGIRGEWHVLKIIKLVSTTRPRYGKIGLNLEVQCDRTPTVQCVCGPKEDSDVVEAVQAMIRKGRGWILSATTWEQFSAEWARPVLLVEEADTRPEHGMEVTVHCSATLGSSGSHPENKRSLLIRHWNPNVDSDLINLDKYVVFCQDAQPC